MTNEDVLTTVLAETTGKPKREVKPIVEAAFAACPPNRGFLRREAPPDLLDRLRREKPLILDWLTEGGRRAHGRL